MRDPHVETLYYTISSHEGISYKDPEPIRFSNHLAKFDLADGSLAVKPVEHFADEDTARQAVEPYLTSWEMNSDLTKDIGGIRFHFERSEIIDRDPPKPGESVTIRPQAGSVMIMGAEVKLHVKRKEYPQPPLAFSTTPAVEMGYRRWIRFREGKASLQSMSFFVLTLIQDAAGGRKKAASIFKIEKSILDNIGELSSTKGDRDTARKAAAASVELTPAEKQWLEDATRKLIYRMGQHASGTTFDEITLSDSGC